MGFPPLERESSRVKGRFVGFRDLSSDPDPDLGFRSPPTTAAVDEECAGRGDKSKQARDYCRRANPGCYTELRCDSKLLRFTIARRERVEICELTKKKAYRLWVDSDELTWVGSCIDFILLRPEKLFFRQLRSKGNRKLSLTYHSNSSGFCVSIVEDWQQRRSSVVIPEGRDGYNLKLFRAQIRSVVCELKANCISGFCDDQCLSYELSTGRERTRTRIEFQPSCCLANVSTTAAVEAPSPSRLLFMEELKREGWWVDTEARNQEGGKPTPDEGTLLPGESKPLDFILDSIGNPQTSEEKQKVVDIWEQSKGVRGGVGIPNVLKPSTWVKGATARTVEEAKAAAGPISTNAKQGVIELPAAHNLSKEFGGLQTMKSSEFGCKNSRTAGCEQIRNDQDAPPHVNAKGTSKLDYLLAAQIGSLSAQILVAKDPRCTSADDDQRDSSGTSFKVPGKNCNNSASDGKPSGKESTFRRIANSVINASRNAAVGYSSFIQTANHDHLRAKMQRSSDFGKIMDGTDKVSSTKATHEQDRTAKCNLNVNAKPFEPTPGFTFDMLNIAFKNDLAPGVGATLSSSTEVKVAEKGKEHLIEETLSDGKEEDLTCDENEAPVQGDFKIGKGGKARKKKKAKHKKKK